MDEIVSAEFVQTVDAPGSEAAAPPMRRLHGISDQARRHNEIRKQVLAAHPELAALNGPDRRTWAAAFGLLVLQWTLVWTASQVPLWAEFLIALFFGQFVYHSAATLSHESAHRLIERSRIGKFAFDILLEATVTSFGRQLRYQYRHITSHHPHLGEYENDYEFEDGCAVVARARYRAKHPGRQRLISILLMPLHLLPYGFLSEIIFLPRMYAKDLHLSRNDSERRVGGVKPPAWENWFFVFWSLAINILFLVLFGFRGWIYQFWAMSIAAGRWAITTRGQFLAEHPPNEAGDITRSTYWWGNVFLFNTGYHYEHHTFPNVAWTRLPKLKKAAPEFFNVANPYSYFGFWWRYLRDECVPPLRDGPESVEFAVRRCSLREPGAAAV